MVSKPIATLDKFSEMTDNGGMFFVDGFSTRKENGISMIYENYQGNEVFNSSTTNFSNITNIVSVIYLRTLSYSSANTFYRIALDTTGKFYTYGSSTDIYRGEIGGLSSSGSFLASTLPDMRLLPSGNILWTSANHAGLLIRGTVKTGSGATSIIDRDGRDFTTLGLTTSAPNNTVTNLKTGSKYTITSISTTTSTNDTLNFTAIGGTTNTAGDEFIGICSTKFDLLSGLTFPKFAGQPEKVYWSRQIKQYGDTLYILNGNYLAKLASDETTFENNFKLLPANNQALAFDVNTDKILISSTSSSGDANLLLWNGYSDGWNNILNIDSTAYAVEKYKSGWCFFINGSLYVTDGYNSQVIDSYVDNRDVPDNNLYPRTFNGIKTLNEKVYIINDINNYNRIMPGVYVYDTKSGFSLCQLKENGKQLATPKSIFVNPNTSATLSISNGIDVGTAKSLNKVTSEEPNNSSIFSKSFVYLLNFKQQQQVKEVQLVLNDTFKTLSNIANGRAKTNITVSVGNCSDGIFKYCQATSISSKNKINVNGTVVSCNVGNELFLCNGDLVGERTFITDITNKGLSNEQWTISPELSGTYSNPVNLKVIKTQKSSSKDIYLDEITEPIRFTDINITSDKMFLEVVVRGTDNSFNANIFTINLF